MRGYGVLPFRLKNEVRVERIAACVIPELDQHFNCELEVSAFMLKLLLEILFFTFGLDGQTIRIVLTVRLMK